MIDSTARKKRLLNSGWEFAYGDRLAAPYDAEWYDVGLPHSFGQPYFMETEFYVGQGTYRRCIDVVADEVGLYHGLEFQGAFQDATVFVNGERAGQHRGGYTAFLIDISALVRPGRNFIAVLVSNEWNARLAPRAGEHTFNGGIYRDVNWITASKVRFGWHGTVVRTLLIDDGRAQVHVETEIVNGGDVDVEVVLTSAAILNSSEHGREQISVLVPAGKMRTVAQTLILEHPSLWDINNPALYVLHQTLSGVGIADRVQTNFGIRTVRFDAHEGFFLNGRHVLIHGANVHQDRAGWGDATTHSGMARDVSLVRGAGMNLIRGSHYPHHVQFAHECDRQGMLYWSELCFWGIGGENSEGFWNASAYPPNPEDHDDFEQSCLQALEEMIVTHRNHPSIITWSVGNEVFFSDDAVIPKAKALTQKLIDLAHHLDPTRPVSVGGAQRRGFDELGDVIGYNGDGAELFHDPGRPNLVSEYGSVIQDRPGAFGPLYGHGVEQAYPWRSGVVLWCGFHHGSIVPEMGHMGFIDYFRLPLRSWYWYREHLLGIEPPAWPQPGRPAFIRLSADRLTIGTDGTDDSQILVELIDAAGNRVSASQPITLSVEQGGGLFPTGTSITLSAQNKSFLDGAGAIEFRSYLAGSNVIIASGEGLPDAELVINAVGDETWSGQERRLVKGPPHKVGIRQATSSRILSEKRPVFASSSRPDRPAHLVTDYSTDLGWISLDDNSDAWISVDLEGHWAVNGIQAVFGADPQVPFHIEIESDGRDPELIAAGNTAEGPVQLRLNGKRLRRVVVRFPEIPTEIARIVVDGN